MLEDAAMRLFSYVKLRSVRGTDEEAINYTISGRMEAWYNMGGRGATSLGWKGVGLGGKANAVSKAIVNRLNIYLGRDTMSKKTNSSKRYAYVEPADYFPKELRKKYGLGEYNTEVNDEICKEFGLPKYDPEASDTPEKAVRKTKKTATKKKTPKK